MEVNACRVDQPFEINPLYTAGNSTNNPAVAALDDEDVPMETESSGVRRVTYQYIVLEYIHYLLSLFRLCTEEFRAIL